MIKKISVQLLGGFAVAVDGRAITSAEQRLTKPWQLFAYLILKNGEVAGNDELIEALWSGEDLADAANVLKNTVYALRRELSGAAKPQDSPIVFRNGGYVTNFNIKMITDINTFETLCAKADRAVRASAMEAYRAAVAAYSGDLLPMLDNEPWALLCARTYRAMYVSAARCLCVLLDAAGLWDELLSVSSRLNLTEPLYEDGYLFLFRALSHKHMYKAIVTTYNKTERCFKEELGIAMSDEINKIANDAAAHVNRIEQDLIIITDDLQNTLGTDKPGNGALFCSYDAFRRMFLLMSRSALRTKSRIELLLFTVQGNKGATLSPAVLSEAMEELKIVISSQLRKSDTCCRYSRRQYAAMLLTDLGQNADKAIERIMGGYNATNSAKHAELICKYDVLRLE